MLKCYNTDFSTWGQMPNGQYQEFSTDSEYEESFEEIFNEALRKESDSNALENAMTPTELYTLTPL